MRFILFIFALMVTTIGVIGPALTHLRMGIFVTGPPRRPIEVPPSKSGLGAEAASDPDVWSL
jgi:hypothetical protein